MQTNNRKNMSYSFDIKFKAVRMYLEEGIGSTTIAKELNLSSNKSDNGRKRMYLSAIEDLYNREIIAYKISDNLDMSFVENTLGEAFKKVSTGEFRNLIIHSDQGVHYKSNIYKSILKKFGVRQSMSRKGNCYDNSCIGNFLGHLKTELIYQNSYNSKEELVKSINDYIYWYNNYRFQAKLKNMTLVEYRCHMIS